VRSRNFWVGRRLYGIMVACQPRFLNVRAADYFLDSFRLGEEKATAARPAPERSRPSPE
jgi:hypothetical protein